MCSASAQQQADQVVPRTAAEVRVAVAARNLPPAPV
jgi:hypothetical protein